MVAAAVPARPPACLEDFLWNLHSVLAATPSPLAIDALKDTYSKQLGHKFAIERWIVGSDQGLPVTLKKIPHIVTQFQANGIACVKSTQAAGATREQLIDADLQYRRELQRKNAAAKAKAGAPPAAKAAPAAAKGSAGPSRPPATLEDFLWNLHSVLEMSEGPLALDALADTYSKQLGHKFAIERFLVLGDAGVGGCLKKIPHVVALATDNGKITLAPTLRKGSTREQLIQADQEYRKSLQAKAKAKVAAAPPANAAPEADTKRTSEGGGEPEAKKAKPDDAETLSKMLVQGVVRVLQQRVKDAKGPLLISQLPDEFKTFWKVPFNLKSAGYTDVNAFLKAWTNKVEVTPSNDGDVVGLAKKPASGEPAPAEAPAKAPAAEAADGEPAAKKARADTETLSRMLVQGVVRVLQNRAKEQQGQLLVRDLPVEFKKLWKVPFNLESAGYTEVNSFLQAWPNKVVLTSTGDGDVVSLSQKSVDKAKAGPDGKAPVPAAAKSAPVASPSPPTTSPASPPTTAAKASGPIPSTSAEIQKELATNAADLQSIADRQIALVSRQKSLLEALAIRLA